jgi:recombination protein RecA
MGRKPSGRSADIVAEQADGLDIDIEAGNSGTKTGKSGESAEKQKALEAARLQIEKQFGQGSLMKLGAHQSAQGIESIPSGSILLDEALGIGGYPRGRIIEIYGPESSGKTTLALHAIAEAQKKGGIAAFIDAEHALDPVYARNLGVDIDELWVSQPDNGEQALDIAESLIRSGAVDVIVVDSVAALTPQAEIEGEMGDAHVGLQARLMSQALRKLAGTLSKSKTILIFINQIRMKIGIMFGNPETTTGGNALKFYASVRLEVRKIETIEKGDEDATGNRVRVKVVKNKVAPPFRRAELDIIFGKGISWSASLLDAAVKYAIIDKRGAWFTMGDEKVGQGRENAKLYLEQNPDTAAKVEAIVREKIFQKSASQSAAASGSAASSTAAAAAAAAEPRKTPAAADPAGVISADDLF